jgi:hypothetical protein
MPRQAQSLNSLVLVNRNSPFYREGFEMVLPYLDHFGIFYTLIDLAKEPFPNNTENCPLVITVHCMFNEQECAKLVDMARAGTGLVIFDADFIGLDDVDGSDAAYKKINAKSIVIEEPLHWINDLHQPGEEIAFVQEILFQPLKTNRKNAIITAGGKPFVSAQVIENGRVVHWATAAWMHSRVLGPLAGMDDIFWRSLVWAARKPFVFRGLPPLVTMRVDDVAGMGSAWSQTPLYWLQTAQQAGFKLGMGLFLYNLTEPAVNELRHHIQKGTTTALPEALGRPPRTEETRSFYYYPGGLPLLGNAGDEFLYFHHHQQRPWTQQEALLTLGATDEWYTAHAPLPKSCLLGPHWYEFSSSTAAHLFDRWGVEFLSTTIGIDQATQPDNPWLKMGPFRKFEEPGTGGSRPVYYADFLETRGRKFFNCITEIRDIAGYEWGPDNNCAETIWRGIKTVRRALDSMALAVLFTHETDYLSKIQPQNLEKELKGVMAGLADYQPVHVTQDEGFRYVRATKTSHFRTCNFYPQSQTIEAVFSGYADVATSFKVFYDAHGEIQTKTVAIPAFQQETKVTFNIPQR